MSTTEEHTFLITQLSLANTSEVNFWVGLHKIKNVLMWNNRATVTSLLPLVDAPSEEEYSDCFVYNGAKVVSFDCSAEVSFVCEQWKFTDDQPKTCPQGSRRDMLSDKCFWFSHMLLSKAGSEVVCTLKHGGLLTMREPYFYINIWLSLLRTPPPMPRPFVLWTSLVFRNGSLQHEDGKELRQNHYMFRRGEGECVALVVDQDNTSELHQKPCLDEALGFCESNVDALAFDFGKLFGSKKPDVPSSAAECPVGFNWQEHEETGFCYWETSYESPQLSWEDARKYCKSYGGDLASFHSAEEEKIGLGFYQFGADEISYWIGAYYDADRDDYFWGDETPMNYTNWDKDQPNNVHRRLRCAQMNTLKKNWEMGYCGALNYFICKAPKQVNPPLPVPPTLEPLAKCGENSTEYFYEGYCYQRISDLKGWHRAQQHCQDLGSNLASLHSENEVDFVIRVLATYSSSPRSRVWIGLNSLGFGGSFKWSDGEPFQFENWDIGEPNNFVNREKCVNMYSQHGMWNDESCNQMMSFVCKRVNASIPEISTTPGPVVGNCKPDWRRFGDSCYLPVGEKKSDRKNWTEASFHCLRLGSSLVSINDFKEQAFVIYLMQNLKMDTWIGLHDNIHSQVYYWTDNSLVTYTNWAFSYYFHDYRDDRKKNNDCVKIIYRGIEDGKWKDSDCDQKLPYVCKTAPDPSIIVPQLVRGITCLHNSDYLKQGLSCYKLFSDHKSWDDAESICVEDGGHLASIYDREKVAVINYLAATLPNETETFWIGLQLNKNSPMKWANGRSMTISKWDYNEPHEIPGNKTCFVNTVSGYWQSGSCSEQKKFVCQITVEEPPKPTIKPTSGNCTSPLWKVFGNKCLFFGTRYAVDWYSSHYRCHIEGAVLASFHSMEDLIEVGNYANRNMRSPVYIGLTKNSQGGFIWADRSPVDFVNWDQGEPGEDGRSQCVEMLMETLKWRVVSCDSRRLFICGKDKENVVFPSGVPYTDSKDTSTISDESTGGLHGGAVAAVVIVLIVVAVAVAVALVRYRPWEKDTNRYRVHSPEHVTGFDNAIYDSNNIDIHDKTVLYENS